MEQFYTLVTDIGKAKIANATALQKKLELCKIVLGDSDGNYYEPTESQTKLKNKVWEGEISDKFIDKDNPNWIVVQTIIPSQIGGFTIREAGIVDAEGDLVVVAKYPETYKPKVENGSTKDITINLILEVSNVKNVTLKVDPTIIFATKKDIENVQKDIKNNLIIGGRNYIRNSGNFKSTAGWSKVFDTSKLETSTLSLESKLPDRREKSCLVWEVSSPNHSYNVLSNATTLELKVDTDYTFSISASAEKDEFLVFGIGDIKGKYYSSLFDLRLTAGEVQKYNFIFKPTQSITKDMGITIKIFRAKSNPDDNKIFIEHMKLEHGIIATDWTPAIEDNDEQLAEMATEHNESTKQINTSIEEIEKKINNYNSYASGKDSKGVYTIIEYKDKTNTLYMKSVLSNPDSNGNYRTDTWSFYENGTVSKTIKWTLTYDAESNITSKVVA
ncbi:hypothetical protein EXQ27_04125 [Clostridium botulinum]|uniref:phage tail protein n=1 Tax=Clostridium botulinum TaxID=1491 RepID=UPI001A9333AB|nr:phage tail protein [Clostridium botulinum]MBO0537902.1 hypothetical protein [Clostridium botulinum]MBO0580388.1 hypothetical protein [Clostridium botulinum]